VFTINVAGQTAASDVNADGTPLTVADLVYLIRVITGDALPISGDLLGGGPKVSAGQLLVTSAQQGANVTVSAKSDADLGAGLFVFNYSGSDIAGVSAMGRASSMNVIWEAEGGQLRVLVLPRMSGSQADQRQLVAAGNGPILNITTHGATVELVSVEAATFMGAALETELSAKVLPTQFALKQNFPNPFNPSTSLAIDFPNASEYKLTIYNIAGQVVKTFQGSAEAGTTTIRWDAKDNRGSQVATGVYFYSVEAGAFKDVKKMVLMK
jgi:flagellar hook assembly protein FlgD